MKRTVTLVALGFVTYTAGCGGGGGDVPLDQLAEEFATVLCGKLLSCCNTTELMGVNASNCEAMAGAEVAVVEQLTMAGVASGRIVYHGDRVRQCFDQLAAQACADWRGDDKLFRIPVCNTVAEGKVPVGGACDSSDECDSGACGDQGSRVCAPRANAGESCSGVECGPWLHCEPSSLVCVGPSPNGTACTIGSDCFSDYCDAGICANRMYCDGV